MTHTQERLTPREHYDRNGYAIFRDVLDPDLMAEVDEHVAWLQRRHPDVRPEQLGHKYVKDDPFWIRLVSDDRLLDIAEQFVGPDIALFASHYISKPPYSGQPVLWHQDGSLWPLDPVEVTTLWLSVDHSTTENGCLRVVPGSHLRSFEPVRVSDEVENVLGVDIEVDVDESEVLDVVLAPGDVEVHHPNIVHGSNANTSPRRRCGLTIRYIPTSTRITHPEQPFPSAFLLRGEPGVNVYQPRPRYVEGTHLAFRGCEDWG
ncbi:phytanoyl-CoA dioxygenase family protein [Jiangella mangrovi]|uniref:Ectoine hydroxylase-related dioxygenase (Phytanoyl-CoA dioxygenase family) n=1 Tax=Jiangella mangrovi TaxID=1524084 RepID=A0A7W9GWB9_9ACTN|nr:phytanoyl-CoA dioxygenase family protein [Jiangella mangrovi]MBB5791252.1 ectoine hydroxylase-related dioxygenase (phytanoyl-CoA dioxygenase family) [Jiangella mangrovi]